MRIIGSNQRLSKPVLLSLAMLGWISVLYLAYVVGTDSWERTMFSISALREGLPEMDPFNQRYVDNPLLTLLHTVPGIAFSILGPLQFMSPIRRHAPMLHRVSGRVFLPIAIASGISAVVIGFRFPIWGWTANQWVTLLMGIFMVFALSKAFLHIRARQFRQHREWMIRGFAVGLSVAFFRVVLNDVLLRNGVEFTQAWNTVTATSAPIMLLIAESWIRATRPRGTDDIASSDPVHDMSQGADPATP